MDEIEVFDKLNAIATPQFALTFGETSEKAIKIAEHKAWLQTIRHERPSTTKEYKIGVYMRYFNQTKHGIYLAHHKKQFLDTIALCPKWKFVDFYVDEGNTAPKMKSSPDLVRLIDDAMNSKVDLIITQLKKNITQYEEDLILLSRLLAAQTPPVGIYIISEDIYTLASYHMEDLRDTEFLPSPDWKVLPDDEEEAVKLLQERRLLGD